MSSLSEKIPNLWTTLAALALASILALCALPLVFLVAGLFAAAILASVLLSPPAIKETTASTPAGFSVDASDKKIIRGEHEVK